MGSLEKQDGNEKEEKNMQGSCSKQPNVTVASNVTD
jgi:hypothetical protein